MKVWKCLACVVCMVVMLWGGGVASARSSDMLGVPDEASIYLNLTAGSVPMRGGVASSEHAQNEVFTSDSEHLQSEIPTSESPVEVISLCDADLDLGMLYGARVVIPEGTRYYASPDMGGSGDYGIIGNRYTPMGTDLYIGGFSLLDEDARSDKTKCYYPENVPVSESWSDKADASWDDIWVAIYLDPEDDSPIGWVASRSVVVLNGVLGDGGTNAAYQNGVEVVAKDSLMPVGVEGALVADGAGTDVSAGQTPADTLLDSVLDGFGDTRSDLTSGGLGDDGMRFGHVTDEETLADLESIHPAVVDSVLGDPGNAIENWVIPIQDAAQSGEIELGENYDPFITTREIAYAIEDYADNGEKVALLLDTSNSVADYVADIANYGEYVEKVNKADIIIAFANGYKVISAEEYLDVDIRKDRTDIYSPLNELEGVADYDRIILVTDTKHNDDWSRMRNVDGFNGKIVVVCPGSLDSVWKSVIRTIEKAFGTTVYLCRLDNQLDQVWALAKLRGAN